MMYEHGNLLEVDRTSHQLFLTFMARFTQFEEMGKLGSQMLAGFHQELELCELWHRRMSHMHHGTLRVLRKITTAVPDFSVEHYEVCRECALGKYPKLPFPASAIRSTELFRRPPLSESSQVLANIIEQNQSERLRTYSEAGCRHFHVDQEVTVKLNNFFQGLKKHVEQAEELLKDLEHLVENATIMMQEATNTMLKNITIYTEENITEGSLGTESEEGSISGDHKLEISDYVAMMSVICNMLRQDYAMQEKVVSDLQLNTPSETLQSYSLMWTLHPFIDERIINKALTWV